MTSVRRGFWLAACLGGLCSGASPLFAQASPEQKVQELNRDAMEAYNALNIDKAGRTLEEALGVAQAGGVAGPVVAQTHMNLGVVLIGGLSDRDAGLGQFLQALCIDPQVQLDPLTSSPDIENVFGIARQQAQGGACQGGPTVAPQVAVLPPDQALAHQPPPEQLAQTPLPLYVEVNPAARAKEIFLFYRGLGMEEWKRVAMFGYQGGFAYQISCSDMWEPKVSYYVQAHDEDGKVVGVLASAATPIEVPVVAKRTQAEPALPGTSAPRSCAAEECPPGLEGCTKPGQAGIGDACSGNADCQSGLSCEGDACVLIGAGSTEVPDYESSDDDGDDFDDDDDSPEYSEFNSFFAQLGFTLGMAYVTDGMIADRPPPIRNVFVDQGSVWIADPDVWLATGQVMRFPDPAIAAEQALLDHYPWVPDADSADSLSELGGSCSADGIKTGPLEAEILPSRYCVRVNSAGFVPSLALRAAVGHFFTPDISAALLMRFQLSAGKGTLANMLIGARGEYMLTPQVQEGLMFSLFAGLTFGQIQAQPSAPGKTDNAPWVTSGLMGVHVGTNIRYRFSPDFGIFFAPELDVQLPTFLLNLDLTFAGAEVAF